MLLTGYRTQRPGLRTDGLKGSLVQWFISRYAVNLQRTIRHPTGQPSFRNMEFQSMFLAMLVVVQFAALFPDLNISTTT